jgi:hypothetical protein
MQYYDHVYLVGRGRMQCNAGCGNSRRGGMVSHGWNPGNLKRKKKVCSSPSRLNGIPLFPLPVRELGKIGGLVVPIGQTQQKHF